MSEIEVEYEIPDTGDDDVQIIPVAVKVNIEGCNFQYIPSNTKSWFHIPRQHKHLYNICSNVIRMFCEDWDIDMYWYITM